MDWPISQKQHQLILEELEALLNSKPFGKARRLKAFLNYIVHAQLNNQTQRINGYDIAIAVFDKTEDFDPQSDTSVRVAAGRLRNKLKQCYDQRSAPVAVRIELPVRSYVPTYIFSEQELPAPIPAIAQPWWQTKQSLLSVGIGSIGVVMFSLALAWQGDTDTAVTMERQKAQVQSLEQEVAQRSAKLARQYLQVEDYRNAAVHFQKALNVLPHNTDYLRALGSTQYQLAQFEQARETITTALVLDEQAEDENLSVAQDLKVLGDYYRKTRQYESSAQTYHKALRTLEHNHEDYLLRSDIHRGLALSYGLLLEPAQANSHIQKAFANLKRSNRDDNHLAIKLYAARGIIKKKQGLNLEAIVDFVQAQKLADQHFGPDHTMVAEQRAHLAMMYSRTRQYEQSMAEYVQALQVFQSVYGLEHPKVAKLYNNMSNPLIKMKRYIDAQDYLFKALQINSQSNGKYRIEYALNLYNLGLVSYWLKQSGDALDYFTRSLSLYTEAYGEYHQEVGEIWEKMWHVSHEMKKFQLSQQYAQNALTVYAKALGENHSKTLEMKSKLNLVCGG